MDPFSAIGGVLGTVGKELCGCIYPKIKSICKFRSNLESLRKEMEDLTYLGDRIEQHATAAERSGRAPALTVTSWLQEFEEIKKKVNSIQAEVQGNDENLCKCHPTCCLRCKMGVEVDKNLIEVKRLIQAGSFPSVMVVQNYQVKKVEHMPGPSIAGHVTASTNLMKVLSLLNDDGVRSIGVWGMGGVGKTTLVKNLNNKLETETATSSHSFSIIIWATASKELDMKRLQTQLLERLNLEVKAGESMDSTASRLHERLKLEKRFLLILDDVWEAIDSYVLGVPQSESHKGSKIILTSRSLDICRQMKTDKDVKVDVLSEEESWLLFTENAGEVASFEHIEPIARKVSRECSGLPLAIKIVGASMRGKTTDASWKVALDALQMSVPPIKGIEEKVFKPLKWSYDLLYFQGMDIKSCFLYCSLYPEDFSIEVRELVQCWIAEDLLVRLQNYEDSVNWGIALVENLKESCLLEDGILRDTVKMHDVVRDVAIWIASSSENGGRSFVRSGIGLNQITEVAFSKTLNRISFMENKITSLPDCSMQCPKVSSLLLQGNLPLEIVPGGFLLGFPELRVLNLSETRIHTLPRSLLKLQKLQALLLRGCQNLKKLPPLGRLYSLQVLDCSQTDIEALPKGMENLTNLRLLDLSETPNLRLIQNGIISKLSCLEIIDMTNSFYKWGTAFDELIRLDRLSAVYIHLDVSCLEFVNPSWIQKLKRYHIVIGPAHAKPLVDPKYDERRVTLCSVDFPQKWVKWWLENASYLLLDSCDELQNMPVYLAEDYCFSRLKSLTIGGICILPPASRSCVKFDLLPNLEELILNSTSGCVTSPGIASISELVHHLGLRFLNLRTIRVSKCYDLKYLFLGTSTPTLKNLEEVAVSSCEDLVELFEYTSSSQSHEKSEEPTECASSSQSHEKSEELTVCASSSQPCQEIEKFVESATSSHTLVLDCIVPKLRIMKLNKLPKLRISGRLLTSWQQLEQLEVIKCNKIKKLPFTVQNASTIKEIRGESQWWNNLEWDDEDTKSSLQQYFSPVDAEGAGF